MTPSNLAQDAEVHSCWYSTVRHQATIRWWQTVSGKWQWEAAGNSGEEATQDEALQKAREWIRDRQL